MRLLHVAVLMALLGSTLAAKSQTADEAEVFIKMGAYVSSENLDRSEAFYRTLFGREPAVRLENFVAFDIAGGWFAIVSRERYAPDSVPGSGAVPYIQSADLEEIQRRGSVALGSSAPSIIDEPGIRLIKLKDPDGQLVEFFSLSAQ